MEDKELIEEIEPTYEPEPFVIPYIYKYSDKTKEYIGLAEADKDPAESRIKGHFIPLVPAYATLLEPPTVEENQIQIYSKTIETHEEPYEVINPETGESHTEYKTGTTVIENWNIEPDYRKNFVKVDNDLNVSEIDTIGEQEGYIIVDKETGEDIQADKGWYKIVDGEIVKKSEKEYEQDQAEKERKRLDALTLTPSDVERALYKAKEMDFEDLKALIAEKAPQFDMKALAIEFRANNFYRGVEVNGMRLIDTVGALLGYTPADMDYLFEHKELPENASTDNY